MSTLIITRGYPGSGKSTKALEWVAAEDGRVRVNRDDLRKNLFGVHSGLSFEQEQAVTISQHAAVRALLKAGKDVIVDDTNLRLRFARNYADIALQVGAEFEVWDMPVDVHECLRRNALRERQVPEDVICNMAAKFPFPLPEVKPSERKAEDAPLAFVPDTRLSPAWLIDVDGTLAHMGDRSPYDITTVLNDEPSQTIIDIANALRPTGQLVIMSGRSEECRDDTETWLSKHLGHYAELHMRAAKDNRADFRVKADLFDAHVRGRWNVLGVLDDRDQVVRMWRSMGLTCLQVAEGNF